MIAIHHTPGSFSDLWIRYCDDNGVPYRLVDCYRSDIVQQMEGCSGLMWHWPHFDHKAALFARQLTLSLEQAGRSVFPDTATSWHYDDKVGQKYLLEVLKLPFVSTYVFYDRAAGMEWARHASYPKVFKLRSGAGSENVKLVRDFRQAARLIRRSFGRGWNIKSRFYLLKERLWHVRRDRTVKSVINIWRGVARLFVPTADERAGRIERRYAYFQDFIPDNDHDIRVVVIGRRAFALKRMVRDGDFRASASGHIISDPEAIPSECVSIAFSGARRLAAQCIAYDFIFLHGEPLIAEISYAFAADVYHKLCPGYWDEDLKWHQGKFHPEYFMVEDFIASVKVE